jgi:immune inhibitor A
LLVSYWDTSQTDNNTSVHPGSGLVLPIDARPAVMRTSSGRPWRGRVQTFDAPFSLRPSRTMVLHDEGRANLIRGTKAQPLFDDTRSYWSATQPTVGVKTPGVGVTLQVSGQTPSTMTVDVGVTTGSPAAALARR